MISKFKFEIKQFIFMLSFSLKCLPSNAALFNWYGNEEVRYFWDYVSEVCAEVHHNNIIAVKQLASTNTSLGKVNSMHYLYLINGYQPSHITHCFSINIHCLSYNSMETDAKS